MNQPISDVLEMQKDLERLQSFVRSVRTSLNKLMLLDLPEEAFNIAEMLSEKARSL